MTYIRQNLSGLVFCIIQLGVNVVGLGDQILKIIKNGNADSVSLINSLLCTAAVFAFGIRMAKERPDKLVFISALPAFFFYPILVRLIIYYN